MEKTTLIFLFFATFILVIGVLSLITSQVTDISSMDRRNEKWEPPNVTPGKQHLGIPVWFHPSRIEIHAGEIKEEQIILKTRAKGQGLVIQRIVPVKEKSVNSDEEIPMPRYLNVSMSPSEYVVSPNGTYVSTLIIYTEPQLPEGEYLFRVNINMTPIITHRGWITVNVSGKANELEY